MSNDLTFLYFKAFSIFPTNSKLFPVQGYIFGWISVLINLVLFELISKLFIFLMKIARKPPKIKWRMGLRPQNSIFKVIGSVKHKKHDGGVKRSIILNNRTLNCCIFMNGIVIPVYNYMIISIWPQMCVISSQNMK